MRQVGSIHDIDGICEDLVGDIWSLRRYDDLCTLGLKRNDGILYISRVAKKFSAKQPPAQAADQPVVSVDSCAIAMEIPLV